jgi:glycosyltransferase involved in cell wall biosynthesis
MSKPLVIIESPFPTQSGYGKRSVDVISALIDLYPNWDIKLVPLTWGATPQNALDDSNPKHKKILDRIFRERELKQQPDIHIQITIANECRPLGKYNILITAGIETDIVSPSWIVGANKMNLILTSSNHSKNGFVNATYNKMDQHTKQIVEQLKFQTQIDTLFEGFDTDIFFKTDKISDNINNTLNEIESDFNFLFVGHWLNGELGHDRKDVGMLCYTFLHTFKTLDENVKLPGLILKTQGASPSTIDKEQITTKINTIIDKIKTQYPTHILPNIYLLHGELSDEELNGLYNHNKVKTYISFTKGEGWNRTPLEFSSTNKPIMISDWSGHLDYLNPLGCTLLKGELKQVHPTVVWKDVIEGNSKWFYVDYKNASEKMIDIFEHYDKYLNKARQQKNKEFTMEKMKERIKFLFDKYIPKELLAEEIELYL